MERAAGSPQSRKRADGISKEGAVRRCHTLLLRSAMSNFKIVHAFMRLIPSLYSHTT